MRGASDPSIAKQLKEPKKPDESKLRRSEGNKNWYRMYYSSADIGTGYRLVGHGIGTGFPVEA
jgi:hypothetical protein